LQSPIELANVYITRYKYRIIICFLKTGRGRTSLPPLSGRRQQNNYITWEAGCWVTQTESELYRSNSPPDSHQHKTSIRAYYLGNEYISIIDFFENSSDWYGVCNLGGNRCCWNYNIGNNFF